MVHIPKIIGQRTQYELSFDFWKSQEQNNTDVSRNLNRVGIITVSGKAN